MKQQRTKLLIMKNSQRCPKCDSKEIIRISGTSHPNIHYNRGNYIRKGHLLAEDRVFVYVTRYVCGKCGFTEEWIDEQKDIQKIREHIGGYAIEKNTHEEMDKIPPWERKSLG